MNNLNLKSVILAILLGMGVGTFLHAQQESPQLEPTKKIIIIKKTIDKDGNEVVEKIVKEGTEAEDFYFESTDGDGEVTIQVTTEGEGTVEQDIQFFSDENMMELENLEGLETIDVKIEKHLDGLEMDDEDGVNHFKFHIESDGEAPEIFEWKGEGEMPAEIKEKIEKMKFKLADPGNMGQTEWNFMRGHGHKMNPGNGAFLGVVLNDKVNVEDGVETREGSSEKGAYISDVREGSAAEKAGLRAGDIITDIDGEPVTSFSDLTAIISKLEPGDQINIAYLRDDKVQTTNATLGKRERKSTGYSVWHDNDDFTVTKNLPCLLIGVYTETVKSIPDSRGVRVTSVIEDTPAEIIKMQKGDVIVALDGVEIETHDELTVERDKHAPGDKVSIVYLRDGREIADEITFRQCEQDQKEYVVRRGPDSKRTVKKNKRIIIIKKKKQAEGEEVAPLEEATPRLAPKESKELSLTAFRAFPNPTDGIVTLRFEGEALPTVVKVTDVTGRELYREELENFPGWYSNRVDLSDAAPGTLLLSIEQDGKVFTEKVVISDGNRP